MLGQHSVKLFLSYSHKDEPFRDVLVTHLKGLERQKVIDVWHDHMIEVGTEWKDGIDENLESADIILLLISADFIASDYCVDIEVPRAMKKHKDKSATVIPISLRPCDTKGMEFMNLQGLPKKFKPIINWECQDEAYADIVKGIRDAAEKHRSKKIVTATISTTHNKLSSDLNEEDLKSNVKKLEAHMDSLLGRYKKNKNIAYSLQEFTKELLNLNSLSEVIGYILQDSKSLFDLDIISLFLVDEKGEIAKFLSEDGFNWDDHHGLSLLTSDELLKSTFSFATNPYVGSFKDSTYGSFFGKLKRKPVSIGATLLKRHDKYLGVLCVGSFDAERFNGSLASDLVERLASVITVCLENNLNFESIQRALFGIRK